MRSLQARITAKGVLGTYGRLGRRLVPLTPVASSGNVTGVGEEDTRALALKPVRWMASSRADLRTLPQMVRRKVGYALYFAQRGEKHQAAKALKGFGDAAVLEVIEDWDRSTYRTIYTVRFAAAVYVLHIFQKKSKRGAATPARDLALIRSRLQLAEHEARRRKEA